MLGDAVYDVPGITHQSGLDRFWRQPEKPDPGLPRIALATGGGYFELTSAANLSATFNRVADELHRQYSLGFTPASFDGKTHKLEVKLRKPGLKARARRTYVARKDVL